MINRDETAEKILLVLLSSEFWCKRAHDVATAGMAGSKYEFLIDIAIATADVFASRLANPDSGDR